MRKTSFVGISEVLNISLIYKFTIICWLYKILNSLSLYSVVLFNTALYRDMWLSFCSFSVQEGRTDGFVSVREVGKELLNQF